MRTKKLLLKILKKYSRLFWVNYKGVVAIYEGSEVKAENPPDFLIDAYFKFSDRYVEKIANSALIGFCLDFENKYNCSIELCPHHTDNVDRFYNDRYEILLKKLKEEM